MLMDGYSLLSGSDAKIEYIVEDYVLESAKLKDEGNLLFKAGDILGSIDCYSRGLSIDPDNHVLYSNRSAAYLKMGDSKSKALHDAEKCIELQPKWSKGYSRLGNAQQALRRFETAIETYSLGLELEPNNKSLSVSLEQCRVHLAQSFEAQTQALQQQQQEEEEEEEKKKTEINIINITPMKVTKKTGKPVVVEQVDKNNSIFETSNSSIKCIIHSEASNIYTLPLLVTTSAA